MRETLSDHADATRRGGYFSFRRTDWDAFALFVCRVATRTETRPLRAASLFASALPAPIPVTTFWAIDIYDTQTRSLLQTIPNKSWFLILRLDGPLQAWFDRTWRSGELQPA